MASTNKSVRTTDVHIDELHAEARQLWPRLESIIDELKGLGPHSRDGNNALLNIREWLAQLSNR